MANSGLIPQLAGKGDLIISDELNHGSIIDGVRLTRADRAIYKHNDTDDLSRVLDEAERHDPGYGRILIITDGVFSMDGDMAPLDGVAELGEEHGAMVYVDDAHGEGVLGEGGRGIVSHFKLDHKSVQVEMGTFSKAYGTIGGHVSGSLDLIKFAWNKSRTWLLSSSHPPSVAASTIAAIDVLETEPQHVKNLWDNTDYFKKAVDDLGFNTGRSQTPIIPVIVGESSKAKALSEALREGHLRGADRVPHGGPGPREDKGPDECEADQGAAGRGHRGDRSNRKRSGNNIILGVWKTTLTGFRKLGGLTVSSFLGLHLW
jgi:glycine C-acetyltransferase